MPRAAATGTWVSGHAPKPTRSARRGDAPPAGPGGAAPCCRLLRLGRRRNRRPGPAPSRQRRMRGRQHQSPCACPARGGAVLRRGAGGHPACGRHDQPVGAPLRARGQLHRGAPAAAGAAGRVSYGCVGHCRGRPAVRRQAVGDRAARGVGALLRRPRPAAGAAERRRVHVQLRRDGLGDAERIFRRVGRRHGAVDPARRRSALDRLAVQALDGRKPRAAAVRAATRRRAV